MLTFTDCTKTGIGGLSYLSTTDSLFDFYTNKTEQHLQAIFIVTYSGLDKTSSVAYYLGELRKLAIIITFLTSVESIDSGEILASVWQEATHHAGER